jgi:hypothetical protein
MEKGATALLLFEIMSGSRGENEWVILKLTELRCEQVSLVHSDSTEVEMVVENTMNPVFMISISFTKALYSRVL